MRLQLMKLLGQCAAGRMTDGGARFFAAAAYTAEQPPASVAVFLNLVCDQSVKC